MEDSETVVAGASTVMDYTSAGYTSITSGDASSNVNDIGNFAASAVAADAGYTVPTGPTLPEKSSSNSVAQGAHVDTAYESETKPVAGLSSIGEDVLASQNATAVPAQNAHYNTVNGNTGSGAESVAPLENGNAAGIADGAAAEQQFVDGSAMSIEEERLWNAVKANSLDFDSWTHLIEETEKLAGDKILKIRKVYDAFLAEFPLCYGYWKKYADHEIRLGFMDKVVEVYERAVLGVTYSVDIWLHYCVFAIETYGDPDTIRRLFERGLAYVGTDYLSYPIWDKYIEYEEMHAEWGCVATLYTRILEIPNKRLDDYFGRFKAFAASRPLSELRNAEEAAAVAALPEADNPVSEGEIHPDAAERSSKPISAGLTEAEELEKFVAVREEMYKKAKEFDSKISDFENAIRRPYFHMKPLPVAELENWHNYLDFIETGDDFNKVVKLYERCLIACANYPEYWMRYVLCMEACGSMDIANNALVRATQVFVKRQPEIHLFAARFREQNGDIPGARASYQRLHAEIAPGLVEAIIKHANMEQRLGHLVDAFSLYEQAIAIEKGKEHSQTLPMLYAQYSRFLYLVSGNAERARDIVVEGLENVQLSKPLLEALIHFETFQSLPKQIDYLDSLVEKFIRPSLDTINTASAADREELSCIFLEFLGMFGDAQRIKKAEDRHAKLFLPHRSKSELKKRHAEDCLASDKAKLPKSLSDDVSSAQSLMGAYPNAQNPWGAGYGAQPQAWPPVAQVQIQQWTPGYGQQAAYGTYGLYGSSYTGSQVPTSVPQVPTSVAPSAGYSAYPSTYPVQAFPQQGYAQPSAAATLAPPAQQPASATQPYYGSYY